MENSGGARALLTTDLTSPNAELIQGVGNGGTSKGVFCVPLRLMVTQLK